MILVEPSAGAQARQIGPYAEDLVDANRSLNFWSLNRNKRSVTLDLSTSSGREIMLSTCLNGQTGPDRMLAGYGTMGACMAGFGELAGWPDRPPAAPFSAYTDFTSPNNRSSVGRSRPQAADRPGPIHRCFAGRSADSLADARGPGLHGKRAHSNADG